MTFVTVHRFDDDAAIQLNAAHIVSMEVQGSTTRLELFGGSIEPLIITETPTEIETAILELEERERVRRLETAFSPDIGAQMAELFHAMMDSPGSPRNPLPVPTAELFRITCPGCGRQTEPGGTLDRIAHEKSCELALADGWPISHPLDGPR